MTTNTRVYVDRALELRIIEASVSPVLARLKGRDRGLFVSGIAHEPRAVRVTVRTWLASQAIRGMEGVLDVTQR